MADIILTAPAPAQAFSPRQIATFYFSLFLDEEGKITGFQQCKACSKCRKHTAGMGYTNLVSHVRQMRTEFEEEMCDASSTSTGTLMPWVNKKASTRYGWLHWIITSNLPFSFCESQETLGFTNLSPISAESLASTMHRVTHAVECSVAAEIPGSFRLMLDGWSHRTEHFLAVFACYDASGGPRYPLLSVAPVMNEPNDQLNAEGHKVAIERFLPGFNRPKTACLLLATTAPSTSDLSNMIDQVKRLSRKLRTLVQAAKLRKRYFVHPQPRDAVLGWYFPLREFILADDNELDRLIPSRATHHAMEQLLDILRDVESVSKRLQSESLTIVDAEAFFTDFSKCHFRHTLPRMPRSYNVQSLKPLLLKC
ncbi:hypothetical protein PPTG_20755 [Phytophthora nicotianae INRA-310]|uniref:BED-type domain-containing protein n=1 Tax=Phytophthora nicotianae (strain INRA-310) TaxID=761204 RepID=W2RHB1_PHYN3|nr:hypothetical protein PPTG_20755 [Phytophthora nicotianae INRA-310]ETN24059.1 hypothetical protein PPTG_20755 [Phytophthora nicotianae INRA-310]